jgi:hypothetical protein
MGMTLWINTLEGRSMSKDSDDHSLMHRYAEQLDGLCAEQGLATLSSFFDHTDLNYSMGDEFGDEDNEADEEADTDPDEDDEPAIDPETGLGYGIDEMMWFDAAAGLQVLTRLHAALSGGALATLKPAHRTGLLEELSHCLTVLDAPARNGARFHLAVIM